MSHNIKSYVTLQNGQYILFHTFLKPKNEGARFHFVEKFSYHENFKSALHRLYRKHTKGS